MAIFGFTQVSFVEIVFQQLGEINVSNMFKKQRFQGVKLVWVCYLCEVRMSYYVIIRGKWH